MRGWSQEDFAALMGWSQSKAARCEQWISRKITTNGIISVAWQEINCGKHRAGRHVDIQLQGPLMQIFDAGELIKTVMRDNGKEVRKKHAARAS